MAIATEGTAYTQAGSTQATAPTAPVSYRIGSRGNEVAIYQERLNQLGYNVGATDGIYGKNTAAQVLKFQQEHGLTADGILGQQTISAMINAKTGTENVAQSQPDYYAVSAQPATPVVATQPQPQQAQAQPDYYAVAPATSQQLGAVAQQQSKQAQSTGTFDPYAMYKPEVAPLSNFNKTYESQVNANDTDNMGMGSPKVAVPTGTSELGIPNVGNVSSSQTNTNNAVQTASPDLGYTSEFSYQPAPATPINTQQQAPVIPANGNGTSYVGSGLKMTAAPAQTVGTTGGTTGGATVSPELQLSVATGNALAQQANDLYTELNTMTPEWNPDEDKDYQRDVVQLENKVSQAMVARGGLYSSVARAAFQSSVIDLELGYRKQAYERFITERDFVFKKLAFVSERIDAEFSKAMSLKNYELAVQKEQFDQKMAIAQFKAQQAAQAASLSMQRANLKASQEAAAAKKQLADAALAQQQTYNNLKQDEARLKIAGQLYDSSVTTFAGDGYLSAEQKAFLGLDSSSGYWDTVNAINNKRSAIETDTLGLKSRTMQFGDAQTTLEIYSGMFPKSTAPTSSSTTYNYNADGELLDYTENIKRG